MNKVFKGLAVVLISAFAFTGCAGLNDSYKDHANAYETHMQYDSLRMTDQVGAIMEAELPAGSNDVAQGMFAAMKIMAVGEVKPALFTLEKPTTAYDVVVESLKIVPGVMSTLGMVAVVDRTVDAIGDEIFSSEGGDIRVEKTEVHTTAIGDGNNMNSEYTVGPMEPATSYNPSYPTGPVADPNEDFCYFPEHEAWMPCDWEEN